MKQAFTLIEIIIVVAIVGIIGSIGLTNYRAREKDNLIWETEKIVSLLREAQSYALEAKTRKIIGYSEPIRPNGYGVFFRTPYVYIFYSDIPDDSGGVIHEKFYKYDKVEEKIAGYFLSPNIIFELDKDLDILFTLPNGEVYKDGSQAEAEIRIILKETTTDRQKEIIINPISKKIDIL